MASAGRPLEMAHSRITGRTLVEKASLRHVSASTNAQLVWHAASFSWSTTAALENSSMAILDRHLDFGNVYGTRRLRWNTTLLYDLPFGRGKQFGGNIPRTADLIVGGWRFSSILTLQTGPFETPYFPNGQGDPSGTGSGLNGALGNGTGSFDTGRRNQHADRVAGASLNPANKSRMNWINAAAFTCPGDSTWTVGNPCTTGAGFNPLTSAPLGNHPLPIGRFGNSQVGSVEGPGLFNLSSGLSKAFLVTDRF